MHHKSSEWTRGRGRFGPYLFGDTFGFCFTFESFKLGCLSSLSCSFSTVSQQCFFADLCPNCSVIKFQYFPGKAAWCEFKFVCLKWSVKGKDSIFHDEINANDDSSAVLNKEINTVNQAKSLNYSWERAWRQHVLSVTYWRTLWNCSKPRSSAARAARQKTHTRSLIKAWLSKTPHCQMLVIEFKDPVGRTWLLLLWRLAAFCLWHTLRLRLCLSMHTSLWNLSFCPSHQVEPRRRARTGRLEDFAQSGTQNSFLLLLWRMLKIQKVFIV